MKKSGVGSVIERENAMLKAILMKTIIECGSYKLFQYYLLLPKKSVHAEIVQIRTLSCTDFFEVSL